MRAAGLTNVSFVVGDLDGDLELDGEFDAVVGRRVLAFVANPVATLKQALRFLRPGGLVILAEMIYALGGVYPPSPLYTRWNGLQVQAWEKGGTHVEMGADLFRTMLDAGLPEPQIRGFIQVYGGAVHDDSFQARAATMHSLRPVMLQHGLLTEAELDWDAVAGQVRAEFDAKRTVPGRASRRARPTGFTD